MDEFPEEVTSWLSEIFEALIGVTNQVANDTLEANSEIFSKVGRVQGQGALPQRFVRLTKLVCFSTHCNTLCCICKIQFLRSASTVFVYKKDTNDVVVVNQFDPEFEEHSVILYLINHGVDVLKQPGNHFIKKN